MQSLLSHARRLTVPTLRVQQLARALPLSLPQPRLVRALHLRCPCAAASRPPVPSPPQSDSSIPAASTSTAAPSPHDSIPNSNSSNSSGDGSRSGGASWSTRIGIAFFLSTACVALYLGQWQVKRRTWKENLIESRTAALRAPPVDLDDYLASRSGAAAATGSGSGGNDAASASSVGVDECKRLRVRGRLLHERTMLLGPRTPPSSDGTSTAGQGSGYYLLTPLRLNDGRMLLVNRGWCPLAQCTRGSQGHVETSPSEDEVEVVGVIRKGEAEPSFLNNYDPIKTGAFVWLDLPLMARFSGVNEAPVTVDPPAADAAAAAAAVGSEGASSSVLLLDALEISGSGPGSRHMRRRGEGHYLVFSTTPMVHAVYAATWFTLAAALAALTFIRFGKKGQQKAAQQALKIARNKQTRFQ